MTEQRDRDFAVRWLERKAPSQVQKTVLKGRAQRYMPTPPINRGDVTIASVAIYKLHLEEDGGAPGCPCGSCSAVRRRLEEQQQQQGAA